MTRRVSWCLSLHPFPSHAFPQHMLPEFTEFSTCCLCPGECQFSGGRTGLLAQGSAIAPGLGMRFMTTTACHTGAEPFSGVSLGLAQAPCCCLEILRWPWPGCSSPPACQAGPQGRGLPSSTLPWGERMSITWSLGLSEACSRQMARGLRPIT